MVTDSFVQTCQMEACICVPHYTTIGGYLRNPFHRNLKATMKDYFFHLEEKIGLILEKGKQILSFLKEKNSFVNIPDSSSQK